MQMTRRTVLNVLYCNCDWMHSVLIAVHSCLFICERTIMIGLWFQMLQSSTWFQVLQLNTWEHRARIYWVVKSPMEKMCTKIFPHQFTFLLQTAFPSHFRYTYFFNNFQLFLIRFLIYIYMFLMKTTTMRLLLFIK